LKVRSIPTGRQRKRRKVRTAFLALLVLAAAGALFAVGAYLFFSLNLPKLKTIDDYQPALPTIMFDKDGTEVARFSPRTEK
jgi:membrane carboxypeptidase/penicillin-binding protein